jgi:hypothetical protein
MTEATATNTTGISVDRSASAEEDVFDELFFCLLPELAVFGFKLYGATYGTVVVEHEGCSVRQKLLPLHAGMAMHDGI